MEAVLINDIIHKLPDAGSNLALTRYYVYAHGTPVQPSPNAEGG